MRVIENSQGEWKSERRERARQKEPSKQKYVGDRQEKKVKEAGK